MICLIRKVWRRLRFLKVGDHDADQQEGGSGIKELVSGGALAGLMSFCASGLRVVADSASFWFKGGASVFQVPMGFSLALLGAGYLVGLTGGIAILLGISIAWGVAVPYLSAHIPQPADMEMIPFAMSLWKEKSVLSARVRSVLRLFGRF